MQETTEISQIPGVTAVQIMVKNKEIDSAGGKGNKWKSNSALESCKDRTHKAEKRNKATKNIQRYIVCISGNFLLTVKKLLSTILRETGLTESSYFWPKTKELLLIQSSFPSAITGYELLSVPPPQFICLQI